MNQINPVYYLVPNAICRKEYFETIVFLKNGKRYRFDSKYYDVLNACKGVTFNDLLSKTNLSLHDLQSFVKHALEKGIISTNSSLAKARSIGRCISNKDYIENSLSFPRFVSLEVTNKCNLSCTHCYSHSAPHGTSQLDLDVINQVIDEISEYGNEFLALGGGEPLIRQDIFEIIKRSLNCGVEVELVSNGLLITDKQINLIKESGLKFIQISLDGSDSAMYKQIRGTDGFSKVVENINLLSKIVNVSVSAVLCKINQDTIFDIASIAETQGASSFRVLRLMEIGRGYDNKQSLQVSNTEFERFLSKFKQCSKQHKIDIRVDENVICNFQKKRIPWLQDGVYGCSAGRSTLAIDSYGDVYPCSYLNYPELKCGNIKKQAVRDIWLNSDILRAYRNIKTIDGKCGTCQYLNNCGGGCRALAYSATRRISGEDVSCHIK